MASINHHGNTGAEPRFLIHGFILWWERAEDISKVIDCILADEKLGRMIDPERIGAAGFSLGGYTALASAGATLDIEKWRKLKDSDSGNYLGKMPPESGFTMTEAEEFINFDPVFTPLMSIESLSKIFVSVMIAAGDCDDQRLLEENGIPCP